MEAFDAYPPQSLRFIRGDALPRSRIRGSPTGARRNSDRDAGTPEGEVRPRDIVECAGADRPVRRARPAQGPRRGQLPPVRPRISARKTTQASLRALGCRAVT